MNPASKGVIAAAVLLAVGGYAYVQLPAGDDSSMAGMKHSTTDASVDSASSKAFEIAMSTMMKGMVASNTGKADLDFVQGMLPHHQGAVDMAKVVLQYGKDAEIRKLAEAVVKAQDAEIAFMKGWLTKTDQGALPVSTESIKANEQAMAAMMKDMMVPYTGDADVDFVKGMIPHHQGAIDMAQVALLYGKDPALLKLANDVVSAQQGEIAFMKEWLKRKGL
jgi:uncharacterized protein (DUF305 family)